MYEAGTDVGGVWYWNRYPGARCDIESIYYNFMFSEELYKEWTWSSRYPDQPSILAYLNHVADRFGLREDICFNTRVTAAHYDEAAGRWRVRTADGGEVSARYFISGVGCLSAANMPAIPGLDSFRGERYHTGTWPHHPVDFGGKRVGVIGTGSSGIQAIPVIAGEAEHLYVFQRTPQYSTPAHNKSLDEAYVRAAKDNYEGIRQQRLDSWGGVPRANATGRLAHEDSPSQREEAFDTAWKRGGWMLSVYNDILTDAASNETVGEFIRGQIRGIVKDPAIAEKLAPDYLYGTKRPVIDTDYFQTYNRDNVTLVDIKAAPIVEITPTGVRTAHGEHELDILVMATGYDAITGPLFRIDIRGREGVSLREKWAEGSEIHTYLGLATAGFPNFFMITGPQSPSVLTNMVFSIEQHVDWIADCLAFLHARGLDTIEATIPAEQDWSRQCNEEADATLFPQADSWYNGANISGKTMRFPIYAGGAQRYREICDKVTGDGYAGFELRTARARIEA